MGDHFVLLVDRLLTESTLEAAIQSRKQGQNGHASASEVETENELSLQKRDFGDGLRKMVECRICHDEDDDSNMETPCSCCGSLKYAHRKCIQRWCNEKGDTVCEICQQQFRPGYTAPPQLFHYGGNPMNFRGNWGISRQDLHDPRFMAMVATDRDFLDVDYDDYSSPSARSMICCRAIAVIVSAFQLFRFSMIKLLSHCFSFFSWGCVCARVQFMVLLVLRHALPIIISGDENYSFTLFIRESFSRFI
ncbi:uncharacterized protein LOC131237702 isoform X3 [Magnolia sinica]|uniref:uncharacterized protein LOC131237702 isoform X3 n=1 Tax=Magnolia sinica TaxID=86752 RepID=UPI00265A6578|nr:uncharacterized protein LOC131237702 isoform X3 [Magnolia sinica]